MVSKIIDVCFVINSFCKFRNSSIDKMMLTNEKFIFLFFPDKLLCIPLLDSSSRLNGFFFRKKFLYFFRFCFHNFYFAEIELKWMQKNICIHKEIFFIFSVGCYNYLFIYADMASRFFSFQVVFLFARNSFIQFILPMF